jgi:hypothetical protein
MKKRWKSTRTSGSQPSRTLNRFYDCIESLSEQSGAEGRHVVKGELVRREEQKKNFVAESAWKSVMNVGSVVGEVK